MMDKIPPSHKLLLVVLSLICLLYGFRNYNALLNSDQYSYLSFARALSRGSLYQEYPLYRLFSDRVADGKTVNLHYGTRNYCGGKVYSGLPIGFPLLLAAALKIGGLTGVFAVNVLLLPVFLIVYYLAVRELYRASRDCDRIALFCAVSMLSVDEAIFPRYSVILMRDLSSVAFFWAGVFCLLRARRRPFGRMIALLAGAVIAMAFSCTIRLTNGVLCLPLGLYGLLCFGGELGRRKVILLFLGMLLVFLLALSPVLLENYSFNKDPVAPLRYAWRSLCEPQSLTGRVLFSPPFLLRHFPSNLKFLYGVYSWVGVFLIVSGIVLFRRVKAIWLFVIPIPLLHLLLYSLFEEDYHRYLIPLYPFLTVLAGAGAIEFLSGLERIFRLDNGKTTFQVLGRVIVVLIVLGWVVESVATDPSTFDWPILFAAIAGLSLILPAAWRRKILPPSVRVRLMIGICAAILVARLGSDGLRAKNFGLREVARLRSQIEAVVPAGSVVWGTRYLIQNVDFYTHAWGIEPVHLEWPFSLTLREITDRILQHRIPLFIFDNKGVKSSTHYLYSLGRDFDLEKVRSWDADDLALHRQNYSKNKVLNLYRIRPWVGKVVELDLPTAKKEDYLLVLDLKNADISSGEDGGPRVFAGRTALPGHPVPGLNFIHLPAYLVHPPRTEVSVVSGAPISRDIFLDLRPAAGGYLLQAGREGKVRDYLFLESGFYKGPSAGARRLAGTGVIRIPVYSASGCRPVLKLKVRNEMGPAVPLKIRLELNGKFLAEVELKARKEWQTVECPLPVYGAGTTSFLTLTVEDGEGEKGVISVEWVSVEQLPLPPSSILSDEFSPLKLLKAGS